MDTITFSDDFAVIGHNSGHNTFWQFAFKLLSKPNHRFFQVQPERSKCL